MTLGNRVKAYRALRGDLTQQDLADRVSCSRQTIHSIESGKFVPSVELALKLGRALQATVEELFFLPGTDVGFRLVPKAAAE